MRFTKPIAAALALTIGALSFSGVAEARHRHHHRGDALAAGIFGFAAGALITGALSQPRYPRNYYYQQAPAYYAPPPVVYRPAYQPAPVYYYAAPQPWTPEWYAYCDARYRSFNPGTGYFLGFDGQYHFCR